MGVKICKDTKKNIRCTTTWIQCSSNFAVLIFPTLLADIQRPNFNSALVPPLKTLPSLLFFCNDDVNRGRKRVSKILKGKLLKVASDFRAELCQI